MSASKTQNGLCTFSAVVGLSCFMLITVWSWEYPTQSHIQYSADISPLFTTLANVYPDSDQGQVVGGEREKKCHFLRGHTLIPFASLSILPRAINPLHCEEVGCWGDHPFSQISTNSDTGKFSFIPNTIKDWNSVPSATISHINAAANPVKSFAAIVRGGKF